MDKIMNMAMNDTDFDNANGGVATSVNNYSIEYALHRNRKTTSGRTSNGTKSNVRRPIKNARNTIMDSGLKPRLILL